MLGENEDGERETYREDQAQGRRGSAKTTTCPTCRAPLESSHPFQPAAPLIRNMVDSLLVRCPHAGRGCNHTCERGLVRTHIFHDCGHAYVGEYEAAGGSVAKHRPSSSFRSGRCECGQKVMRKDWEHHTTSGQCTVVRVPCPFGEGEEGCKDMIKERELDEHLDVCPAYPLQCPHCSSTHARRHLAEHEAACDDAVVECPHARHGCGWSGRRSQVGSEHLPHCVYAPLAAFFERNADEMETLRSDNARLTSALDDMSRRQMDTEKMLAACIRSLGAFYVDGGTTEQGEGDGSGAGSADAPALRQSSIPSLIRNRSGSAIPLPSTQAADDAPATPPLPLQRSSSEVFPAASTSAPAVEPSWRWPEHEDAPRRLAPLDRSSSLSHQLIELQSVLNTLTTQLHAAERRAEEGHLAALSAGFEASRAHEEMNSQRHALHAMRLQIHQLAMVQQQQRGMPPPQRGAGASSSSTSPQAEGTDVLHPPPPPHQPAFPIPIAPMAPHFRRFWTGFEQTKL